jgi:hypothetical protein
MHAEVGVNSDNNFARIAVFQIFLRKSGDLSLPNTPDDTSA